MYPGVYLGLCVDLIQQTAEVGHFLLQVFSLDLQLVAQGLGFLVWVQWKHQLFNSSERCKNIMETTVHVRERHVENLLVREYLRSSFREAFGKVVNCLGQNARLLMNANQEI